MPGPRVRFAPSPTGYLHLGSARSALYNWLWARGQGGRFILRVEDTDRERSTDESLQVTLESLRWLGLDWDEGPGVGGDCGPYMQTERLSIYADFADRLVRSGHGYRCYCTREELAAAREAQKRAGEPAFRYPGTCRERRDEPDRPHVIRLRAPAEGATAWDDRVKGRIEVRHETLQDSVLVRTDGVPLYNFGATVDDITMEISLVARGDDHMINTPIQILLYQAFGVEPPQFAHLPMILGADGQKLSKRHAAVAVLEYRDAGYLADGVINYLARLGWSHGDQEIFTRQELIEKFGWDHVGTTGSRYDAKKFEYVQAEHLRMLPHAETARHALPFVEARGAHCDADDPRLVNAIQFVKLRSTTLADIARDVDYFLREPPEMEDKSRQKHLVPAAASTLRKLAAVLGDVEPFEIEPIEARVTAWMEGEGLTMKDVAQAARVAMTGRTRSPGLFEVMWVLGKATTTARLLAGAVLAEAAGGAG